MFIIIKDVDERSHVCFLGTLEVFAENGTYYITTHADQTEKILVTEQEYRRIKMEKKQEDAIYVELE